MSLLDDLMKRKAAGFAPTPEPFKMDAPVPVNVPQPQLSDGITFPGLDQIGAAGAAEFNAPKPETYNAGTLGAPNFDESYIIPQAAQAYEAARIAGETPSEPTVGDRIMGNLAESRLGKYLGGMRTLDVDASGRVDPSTSTPVFKGLAERTGTEAYGADIPEVLPSPSPVSAPPAATASELPVATPATTAPAPAAPAAPTPQAPQAGGITRADGTFTPTQQPTGGLATFEDRLKETIAAGGQTPQMIAQAASEASPSASASQVALAEGEAAQRQAESAADAATAEFAKGLALGGSSIAARDAKISKFREDFVSNQAEVKTRTPEQIEADERKAEAQKLDIERKKQVIDAGNQPDATPFAKKRGEFEERAEALLESGMGEDEVAARRQAFLSGDKFDLWQFREDQKGKAPAPTEGEATPAANTSDLPEGMPAASGYNGKTLDTPGGQYKSDGTNWTKV